MFELNEVKLVPVFTSLSVKGQSFVFIAHLPEAALSLQPVAKETPALAWKQWTHHETFVLISKGKCAEMSTAVGCYNNKIL